MNSLISPLLFLLASNQSAIHSQDPCDFTSSAVLRYHQVLQCYETTPFDAEDRAQQISVFSRFLEFTDLGSNYDAQVGWRRQLKKLARTKFRNDFDMNAAFRRFVLSFKNGHFNHVLPYCYGGIVFPVIPLDFGSAILHPQPDDFFEQAIGPRDRRRPRQIIYVDGTILADEYQAATGIDATQFVGQRVVSINGQNPIAFLRRFGRRHLMEDRKDSINLNEILESGAFSIRPGPSDTFPRRQSNRFVFEDEAGHRTRVNFPWIFLPSIDFGFSPFPLTSSTDEFAQACAAPNPIVFPGSDTAQTIALPTEGPWSILEDGFRVRGRGVPKAMRKRFRRKYQRGGPFVEVPDELRNVGITEIVPETNGARVVQFEDNTTAIQLRSNFVSDWREVVRQGAAYACENSENLILDVRSNGGGRGDLIEWFARYFRPNPRGPGDFYLVLRELAADPAQNELREYANLVKENGFPGPCSTRYDGDCYADPFTRLSLTDPDWYRRDTIEERRGRDIKDVTRLLSFADGILGVPPNETLPCPGRFEGPNLIALVDGLNGSAGFFAIEKLRGFATIVATGGIIGSPMATGVARGGATTSVSSFRFDQLGLADFLGVEVQNPLPSFERFVFFNIEFLGSYAPDLVNLYADTDLPPDVRINVWSNTEDTDGFVYSKVLEGVRRSYTHLKRAN